MKKIIFLLLVPILIQAQFNWQNIGPGAGSDLKCIAIHPTDPNTVYIGGDIEGIYKTTDGGNSWQSINNNLALDPYSPGVYYVQDITFDTEDNSYKSLYIATTIGVFKTIDAGNNWVPLLPNSYSSEEDIIPTSFIVLDPANSNIIYVGTGIQYDVEEGKGIIYKSTDGGSSWSELTISSDANTVIQGIYIDPLSPPENRIIYASTSDGIYKSTDNGNTWSGKNNGLPHKNLRRLKGIVFNNQLYLYLTLTTLGTPGNPDSFNGGIYKSSDGGENWVNISGNLPKYQDENTLFYFYWKFALHPSNQGEIYIATTRGWPEEGLAGYYDWGIYKTADDGTTWQKITNNIEFGWLAPDYYVEDNAFILEISDSNPNIIYWGLVWMSKSTDGGSSWKQIYTEKNGDYWKGTGMELMAVDILEFDPADANKVYVGYDDFGLFKSIDGGSSFRPLEPKQDPYDGYDAIKDIVIDPLTGIIYESRWEGIAGAIQSQFELGQIWKSLDGGENWEKISSGLPDGTPKLIMDYNSDINSRIFYCTIYKSGVYKSSDNGASWQQINNGLGSDAAKAWEIDIDQTNSNILYLGLNGIGSGGGLYISTDAGTNWSKLNSFPDYDVLSIEINNAGTAFVGAVDNFDYNKIGGLYKSEDNGSTWNSLFNNCRIIDIEFDPNNNDKIYFTSQAWYLYDPNLKKGVYLSENGGNNWTDITGNIGNSYTRFIKINPSETSKIYLGTNGGGIWMLDLSITGLMEEDPIINNISLEQNYPNPFNPTTTISFSANIYGTPQQLSLKIYDVLGNEVLTVFENKYFAGEHKIQIDKKNLPSGVYFYKLTSANFSQTKKMILLK